MRYLPDIYPVNTSYLPADPDKCKQLLVPIQSPEPNHWLLAVVHMGAARNQLLDLCPSAKHRSKLENLSLILSSNKKDNRCRRFKDFQTWSIIESEKVPFQKHCYDRGIHVIKNMQTMDDADWYNYEYFKDLEEYRVQTLASFIEWEQNYIKDEVINNSQITKTT